MAGSFHYHAESKIVPMLVTGSYVGWLLLHLNKHSDRFWTPRELKTALQLDLSEYEIQDRLITMSESDLIARGTADIDFRGLQDGTLDLILRNRFEKEINQFMPDLKEEFQGRIGELQKENRRLRGMLNHLSGRLAEVLLANELRAGSSCAYRLFRRRCRCRRMEFAGSA